MNGNAQLLWWLLLAMMMAVIVVRSVCNAVRRRGQRRDGRKAVARVFNVWQRRDESGIDYPVSVRYSVDGEEHEGPFSTPEWQDYTVGQAVEILYLPDEPEIFLPRSRVTGEPD